MKILAAGDIHGDVSKVVKLRDRAIAHDVDAIVLCGDLTLGNQLAMNVLKPFMDLNKEVLLIPGNHEDIISFEMFKAKYDVIDIHGKSFVKDDVGLFGCGFANLGVSRLTEDEIFNKLKDSNVEDINNKVMVTHVHPQGSKMENFSHFVPGSSGVTKAIYELKPKVLLCSHIHEAEGIEEIMGDTLVINVGSKGKILDF